ncbi:MAG: NUDIX hydrolase [Beijerinckiaceae bacterium]|nr:NUDIX hydrolase [Beijerinckiaceae bacterium]
MSSAAELTKRMTNAERERRWPNLKPKDAATLILIDRVGPKPKVLMGKRHPGHKFMPGKFVFPGGRIEGDDRKMSASGMLHPIVEEKLLKRVQRPTLSRARALGLAAIRETFEETGLMIGTREHGAPEFVPEGPWTAFKDAGVFPDLEALHFIARAVTPPKRPKRFDARFFAVDASAIAHKVEGVVGPETELVELVWIPIEEAKTLDLPTITTVVIDELQKRIEAGMHHRLPVPFYYEVRKAFQREEL